MKSFTALALTVAFVFSSATAQAGSLAEPAETPPVAAPPEPRPEGFSSTLLVIAGVLAVLLIAANAEQDN